MTKARKRKRTWSSKRDGLRATTTDAATANVIAAAARVTIECERISEASLEHMATIPGGLATMLAIQNLKKTLDERERLFSEKGGAS